MIFRFRVTQKVYNNLWVNPKVIQSANSIKETMEEPLSYTYSIKQTATLYRISIDTLRYYEEIGLVVPSRNPKNGYRQYQAQDFSRLNIISSLLEMDFTLAQIKELFDNHSLSKSLDLIALEAGKLTAQIDTLTKKRKKVESCLLELARSIHAAPNETITLKSYPERPYLNVGSFHGNSNVIPLAVALKAHELGFPIDAFHSIPCFLLNTEQVDDEGNYSSSEVFMYSASPSFSSEDSFPAGDYVCVTFSGGAAKTPHMYKKLCQHMEKNRLIPDGSPIEFWHVHEYISDNPSEYIQTLEQKVTQR